jgi:hypothetical protein
MHNGSVMTSKFYTVLSRAMHDNTLSDYILRETKWSATIFAMVDWDTHERAFKRLTQYQKITTVKLIHNLANTNHQNHLYYGKDNRCPVCQSKEEMFEHILKCSLEKKNYRKCKQPCRGSIPLTS